MRIDGTNGRDNLYGTADPDQIWAYAEEDTLIGFGGDDVLVGGDGRDSLYGGPDNDTLRGGEGADLLDGGIDTDTASYEFSHDAVNVSIAEGLRVAAGGTAEGDTLVSIENLTGSGFDDELWGDSGANVLRGLAGDDLLKGFGGADTLWGGNDNDKLLGLDGTDTLRGEGGNDTMDGGAHRDNLYGGIGGDTFVWSNVRDTGLNALTADVVWDFNRTQGDRIDLSAVDADAYATGDQRFSFIGTAAFTLNTATSDPTDVVPGEIRYYHSGGSTYIEMQTGTAADIEGLIRLNGIYTPDATWFVP